MNKNNSTDIKKVTSFIEELSWLLDSRKGLDLKKVVAVLKGIQSQQDSIQGIAKEYISPNPNKHFLIGVLPKLFQDSRLFPTSDSIINFASEILKIKISKFGKRSKNEIIGKIVCETESLNDKELARIVTALSQITGNEEKLNKIREERKNINFSWNETIQKLTEHRK